MSAQIRVTVEDLKTGKTDSVEIADDYVLITAGTCRQTHICTHGEGTHVLTVKGRKGHPIKGLVPNEEPEYE